MADIRQRPQAGVTLIELAVGVAILVILATLAVPSFSSLLASWRVKAAAGNVLAGLQFARAEAIRQNATVGFAFEAATGNWLVTLDARYDSSKQPCDATLSEYLRQSCGEGTGVTNAVNFTYVSFSSQGRATAMNLGAQVSLPQVDLGAAGTSTAWRILISSGGQARLCDPASPPSTTDPRYCSNL